MEHWAPNHVRRFMELAGRVPAGSIAVAMGTSAQDVEEHAAALGIDLRIFESGLDWCQECSSPRKFTFHGKCPVCQMRENVFKAHERLLDACQQMGEGQRDKFDVLTVRGYKAFAIDAPPSMREWLSLANPGSRYEAMEALECYFEECQAFEYRRLEREYDALRSKLGRYRKAINRQASRRDARPEDDRRTQLFRAQARRRNEARRAG